MDYIYWMLNWIVVITDERNIEKLVYIYPEHPLCFYQCKYKIKIIRLKILFVLFLFTSLEGRFEDDIKPKI